MSCKLNMRIIAIESKNRIIPRIWRIIIAKPRLNVPFHHYWASYKLGFDRHEISDLLTS